jgi:ectoine hydroxylase-related dioxygenase (phytanoyl-CoA dioxygenase family)
MFLDKHPLRPWALPWHRDVVYPVSDRDRCQVPQHVLERMVAVRIHLDAADEANGTLLVVPGSHVGPSLPPAPPVVPGDESVEALWVAAGDAVLMSPLLLHRSARSTVVGRRRRVLHFDIAPEAAISARPLWRDAWPI